jgi:hypothetical protein
MHVAVSARHTPGKQYSTCLELRGRREYRNMGWGILLFLVDPNAAHGHFIRPLLEIGVLQCMCEERER